MRASVQGVHGVLGLDVKPVDVVQPAIPGFGDHRQRPIVAGRVRGGVRHAPLNHRVAHHAHAVSVGDHHRAFEKSGFLDPCGAGHLAVAVLREPGGEYRIGKRVRAAGQHGRHAGAHRTLADLQFARSGDQRRVADRDAGHVRDGIERSGGAVEGHSQIPCAGLFSGRGRRRTRAAALDARTAKARQAQGLRLRNLPLPSEMIRTQCPASRVHAAMVN